MKNFFLRNPVRAVTGLSILMVAPVVAMTAAAQNTAPPAPTTSITNITGLFTLINNIFNILFWLLIVLAAIFIIRPLFSYLTAGGEPEKIQAANKRVIYAAVAVVVGVLAKAIPSIVCTFIATSCTSSLPGTTEHHWYVISFFFALLKRPSLRGVFLLCVRRF